MFSALQAVLDAWLRGWRRPCLSGRRPARGCGASLKTKVCATLRFWNGAGSGESCRLLGYVRICAALVGLTLAKWFPRRPSALVKQPARRPQAEGSSAARRFESGPPSWETASAERALDPRPRGGDRGRTQRLRRRHSREGGNPGGPTAPGKRAGATRLPRRPATDNRLRFSDHRLPTRRRVVVSGPRIFLRYLDLGRQPPTPDSRPLTTGNQGRRRSRNPRQA